MKRMKILVLAFASLFFASETFAQSGKLNDAQIAAIVVAANTVDINAGKLAEKQARNNQVRTFGRQMVTDHTGVNKQATALVTKLKLQPEESDASKKLKSDGDANITHLKKLKGKAFDHAYIDNEVIYHQAVIDMMDKTLVPDASNAELKDLLTKVRPAFVAHLDHAKKIQTSLK